MSTTHVAAPLFQLQQLDLELERLAAERQGIKQALSDNRLLARLRQELASARQQLQAGQQAQQEAEWTLEEINRRLQTLEQRLYSGSVTSPKELTSLQQEVQHLRAQQSRQEERTLEAMDLIETLQRQLVQREEELRRAEMDWEQQSAAHRSRLDQLEQRRRSLEEQRAALASSLPADLLTRYETLRRTRQGRAISRVEQNACQWCRVLLTSSEMQRVRLGTEIQTCSNCGRILFYDR
ncbi:zinc ribbon domain-containing protein [Thermogemmatispora sp.]|uniref:zinc ribbon domain-containing protein n=1 Tax=Thermogemmatispora sp. TaxID=1968838 RepID=UPI0035E4334E